MPTRGGKRSVEQAAARPRARDIPARCREANVDLVRFLYCGNDSVIRGKASHTRFLNSFMRSGIGLTVAMQSFNMLDQLVPDASFGPVGEIRLMPDPETLRRPAVCAALRPAPLRHAHAGRRALGRLPAQLLEAHDRARARGRPDVSGLLRERVHAGAP